MSSRRWHLYEHRSRPPLVWTPGCAPPLECRLDPAILEKTGQEERLVRTFDLDFGALLATGVHGLPSVILLRMRDQTPSYCRHHHRAGRALPGAPTPDPAD